MHRLWESVWRMFSPSLKIINPLESLVERRTKLQNKIRRATLEQKAVLRKEKSEVTAQITSLRKEIRDSKEIEQRAAEIQNTLDRAFEAEHPHRDSQKRMRGNR